MKTMYSWSDYEAAMKQINKSQLPKNRKSPKSWVRFKITEVPFSNQRWAAFFRGLNPYSREKFFDSGVLIGEAIIPYPEYLTSWGFKDNTNKWRSYEQRYPSIYVLDNKWIIVQKKYQGIPSSVLCYYFDSTGEMKSLSPTEEINSLFNAIGTQGQSGETFIWRNGIPDYEIGYKNKKNKDDQFYWSTFGGGYRGINTHLTLSELVYRKAQATNEENKDEIWGSLRDGIEKRTIRGLSYENWINKTLQQFSQATPVVIPPELPWIINWQNLNAFIGRLLT